MNFDEIKNEKNNNEAKSKIMLIELQNNVDNLDKQTEIYQNQKNEHSFTVEKLEKLTKLLQTYGIGDNLVDIERKLEYFVKNVKIINNNFI